MTKTAAKKNMLRPQSQIPHTAQIRKLRMESTLHKLRSLKSKVETQRQLKNNFRTYYDHLGLMKMALLTRMEFLEKPVNVD